MSHVVATIYCNVYRMEFSVKKKNNNNNNCQTTTSGVLSSQNHKQLQTTGGLFKFTQHHAVQKCHGPPENPEKTFGIFLRLKFLENIVLAKLIRNTKIYTEKIKRKEKLTKGTLARNVFENRPPVV